MSKKVKILIVVISLIIISILIPYYKFFYMRAGSFKGTPFEISKTQNFNTDKINALTKHLKEKSATTGLLVLKDGKITYSYGDIKEVSYLASCRKSILSMLYGKHVENGIIDLEETIGDIGIDEDDGLLEIEKTATVNHIVNARSGVFHIPANGGYDIANVLERGSVKPGEYFLYNNWDYNVAGHILETKTGNTVYEELETQLAKPLGFQDWNIKNQRRSANKDKSRYSAYHMYLSTRDMAKIGQLMLNNGSWNGKQLVSKEWIQKTTTTTTPKDTVNKRYNLTNKSPFQFSYSHMWWLFENLNNNPDVKGAYTARGYGGQYITVIPKRNMVIAHKTKMDMLYYMGFGYDTSENQYFTIVDKILDAEN